MAPVITSLLTTLALLLYYLTTHLVVNVTSCNQALSLYPCALCACRCSPWQRCCSCTAFLATLGQHVHQALLEHRPGRAWATRLSTLQSTSTCPSSLTRQSDCVGSAIVSAEEKGRRWSDRHYVTMQRCWKCIANFADYGLTALDVPVELV
jgi:hypothetical protein